MNYANPKVPQRENCNIFLRFIAAVLLIFLSAQSQMMQAQTIDAQITNINASAVTKYIDQTAGKTADDLVADALADNAELEAVRREVEAADALVKQANLRANPTLEIGAGKNPFTPSNSVMVGGSLPLKLYNRRGLRVHVAEREAKVRRKNLVDRERLLAAEVRSKFGETLALILKLSFVEETLTATTENHKLVAARVDEGKTAPLEQNMEAVELNRIRAMREASEGQVEIVLLELKNMVGMPPDELLRLVGKLTDIAAESRSELDAAALKIAEADHLEHLSHFNRTIKLLKIGADSREEYEEARAKHDTANAKLVEAQSRFERAGKLLDINPVRRAELDSALRQLKNSQAELAAMRQKLLVLGLPAQKVESLISTTQISSELPITSPVSGTVTTRKVNQGEAVAANAEMLTVTNLSTVWVIGQVYEKDLASLQTGSGASVTSDAYPGQVFRGNVSYIDPNLDQNTRTAQIRIELSNPNEKFKVGMYVNIAFANIGGSENTVPTVPVEAVQTINNQYIVFVATDNPNMFIVKPVKIGTESSGLYPVLEGLFVGDRVVTDGSFLLRAEWQKSHQ